MPADKPVTRTEILTRWAAALALPLLLAACPYVQRVDLPENGRADAANCVEVRGGDAKRAGESCERRGFHKSPAYRTAYLEMTQCVVEAGGTASAAVERCRSAR